MRRRKGSFDNARSLSVLIEPIIENRRSSIEKRRFREAIEELGSASTNLNTNGIRNFFDHPAVRPDVLEGRTVNFEQLI